VTLPILQSTDATDARLDAIRRAPAQAAPATAARELEIVFFTQLLQAMRRTIPENDFLPRSPERDVYDGVFDHTVAEAMAVGDPLGLVRDLSGAGLKVPARPADSGNGRAGSGDSGGAGDGPRGMR
jgi:Rod binding domain-containing protein